MRGWPRSETGKERKFVQSHEQVQLSRNHVRKWKAEKGKEGKRVERNGQK